MSAASAAIEAAMPAVGQPCPEASAANFSVPTDDKATIGIDAQTEELATPANAATAIVKPAVGQTPPEAGAAGGPVWAAHGREASDSSGSRWAEVAIAIHRRQFTGAIQCSRSV